jgi:hypothetical protein
MAQILVELTTNDRIGIESEFTLDDLKQIKQIPGARKPSVKQPVWTVNKDLRSARRLRLILGKRMILGPQLHAWAKDARDQQRNLRRLHSATDAELERVPERILKVIRGEPCPEFNLPSRHPLNRERPERPYQRADIKMTGERDQCQPGRYGQNIRGHRSDL